MAIALRLLTFCAAFLPYLAMLAAPRGRWDNRLEHAGGI
jgi:hypothetical protein